MSEVRILQVGMGPLGRMMSRYISERSGMRITGAVDVDLSLIGRALGELCSVPPATGAAAIRVSGSLGGALGIEKADAALLTTESDMKRITPQIIAIIAMGLPVVTTCEELVYPWDTSPELAAEIDDAAKRRGVCVLATGVNPGFMMDTLAITLTAVCQRIDAVKVYRVQNAVHRRLPFQRKIGAGLTPVEFEAKHKEGTLRHVGLTESMHMIASRLGWHLERIEETLTPIIAQRRITAQTMVIEPGMAAGVQQIGRGFAGKNERITLTFRASVGEPEPHDTVEILGEPNVVSSIKGGVNGDLATCAIALNAIHSVLGAGPGLKTMVDIPPVSHVSTRR